MGGLGKLFHLFWNALFPRACVLCKREGEIVCATCEKGIRIPAWHKHAEHEGVVAYSRVSYKERAAQKLLHAWKYQGDQAAGAWWTRWIQEKSLAPQIFAGACFVPVPLAREAHAERGFNQAEVLARALAQAHGGTVHTLLGRFPKKAQAKTEKTKRHLARQHNPYFVRATCAQKIPHTVVLVDDVYTTGNTMMACADVLRAQGVQTIFACTLAYGNDA